MPPPSLDAEMMMLLQGRIAGAGHEGEPLLSLVFFFFLFVGDRGRARGMDSQARIYGKRGARCRVEREGPL